MADTRIVAPTELVTFEQKCAAASNPDSTVETLCALACDYNQQVRTLVAANPSTPEHCLQALSAESLAWVCHAARRALRLRRLA